MVNAAAIPAQELEERLKAHIRDVPDFPKPGIVFKDITTLLKDPGAMKMLVEQMALFFRDQPIDYIVGIESRGFILGMPMAYILGCGFIPVRKPGKLPAATHRREYALEYGTDSLEIHCDALESGQRVVIVDDLLATGGTASAAISLVQETGAEITAAIFAIELEFLNGREKLSPCKTISLIKY
ncbi:MAG: adenine phosphoribosyltransferase [Candidatus Sericytochromatia bacterium]